MPRFGCFFLAVCVIAAAAGDASAQSLNVDFGQPGDGPGSSYAAAGLPGHWNSIVAAHGTTTFDLVGLDGLPTSVRVAQIGGLETVSGTDAETSGDHALLMDDYLLTEDAGLESCLFFDGLIPGEYEVLIYARMPAEPGVLSDTFVDQEVGVPHYQVGGVWPGDHQLLVSYSRHVATVGEDGSLDMHSGIAPGADPNLGAALNGVQLRLLADDIFQDGFESGDLNGWQ